MNRRTIQVLAAVAALALLVGGGAELRGLGVEPCLDLRDRLAVAVPKGGEL